MTIYLKVQVVLSIYVLLLRKKWKVALSEWQIVVLNIIQNFSIIVYNRLWILLKLKRNNLLILMLPWYLLTHIKRQIWVRLMLHVILNLVVLYVIYLLLMNRLEAIVTSLKRIERLLLALCNHLVLAIIIICYLLCTRIYLGSQIFIMK